MKMDGPMSELSFRGAPQLLAPLVFEFAGEFWTQFFEEVRALLYWIVVAVVAALLPRPTRTGHLVV